MIATLSPSRRASPHLKNSMIFLAHCGAVSNAQRAPFGAVPAKAKTTRCAITFRTSILCSLRHFRDRSFLSRPESRGALIPSFREIQMLRLDSKRLFASRLDNKIAALNMRCESVLTAEA